MRFSDRLTQVFFMNFAAVAFSAISAFAMGQNTTPDDGQTKQIVPSELKTLEQIRSLCPWQTGMDFEIFSVADSFQEVYAVPTPPDPRQVALKKIEEAKAKLAADEDRSVVEPLLKAALAEYFIADMRHRVRELDDIKAKVAESEAKLQKRLDSQQESVDLQLKIMLREADGHGFFRSEDKRSASQR